MPIVYKISNYINQMKAFSYLKKTMLISILSMLSHPFLAQESIWGTPPITHYEQSDYHSDSQFWAACEDDNGIMYFGNNDGALIFEGAHWTKVQLPNNSSVRSLCCASNGVVYAGGYNEFGTIVRDSVGNYHFQSLLHLIRSEDSNFENIWQIHEINGSIVFQSYSLLFIYSENHFKTIKANSIFKHSTRLNNLIYLTDIQGISTLNTQTLQLTNLFSNSDLRNQEFLAILNTTNQNEKLVFTKQGGVFKWNTITNTLTYIESVLATENNNLIITAIQGKNNHYYLGSLSRKLQEYEYANGQMILVNDFNLLKDNTILNLFETRQGNIWVLLNKGLAVFDRNASLTTLFKDASVFDVLVNEKKMYLATNQGVFVTSKPLYGKSHHSQFEKIPGIDGQTWSLQLINNQILCCHDKGLFQVTSTGVKRIGNVSGVWKTYPVTANPQLQFVCTYDGLYLMKTTAIGTFEIIQKIEGFNTSSRDIMATSMPDTYWICHGYKGVYKIKLNSTYTAVISTEHFLDQNGLPSAINNNVFKFKDQIVFTTNKGIFTFDDNTSTFLPHAYLCGLLGTTKNTRKITSYKSITWVVIDDEIAFFENTSQSPVIVKEPFLSLKGSLNRGMECLLPIHENNLLIGTTSGLFAYNNTTISKHHPKVIISKIAYSTDTASYNLIINKSDKYIKIPHHCNNLEFWVAAPQMRDKANTQFRYLLEGAGNTWSEWQSGAHQSFTHLPAGKYTLRIMARSLSGETSQECTYSFEIEPIWYKTRMAITFWMVIFIVLIWIIQRYIQKRIQLEKEKTRTEEKKLQKVLELELAQLQLEKENRMILEDKNKLEEDVIDKSKELVNYTMLLAKKRELMIEMQQEITELNTLARNDTVRSRLKSLSHRIEVNLNDEQFLQLFDINFERVHHTFFEALKHQFPELSAKELRLCAFIRMNLSTKEIASILNISIRGAETARYRLKKRLNTDAEENLKELFDKLESGRNRDALN